MSSEGERIVESFGGLPNFGIEYEIVLERNGRVVYDEDEITKIVDTLRDLGFCVGYESRAGHLPPRIEIKLCKPTRNIDEIVNYFKKALEEIRKLGYEPRIERWGESSGSVHVTIDEVKYLLKTNTFVPSLYLLTDNFSKKSTCKRVGKYWSIASAVEITYESEHGVQRDRSVEYFSQNDVKFFIIFNNKSRILSKLLEAVKNGDVIDVTILGETP